MARVIVTAAHIADGRPRPAANPVALAARAAFPGSSHVVCGAEVLYLTMPDGWRYEHALPEEVSYLLAAYYDGEPLTPFSFAAGEPVFAYRWRPVRTSAARGRAA